MTTNGLIKLILGIALVLAFIPAGYVGGGIQGIPQMILVVLCVILGIKLIMDGFNEL